MNKEKKKTIILMIVVILIYFLFELGIILFFTSGFNDKYDIVTDKDKYNDFILESNLDMNKEIFPRSIETLNVIDFKYVYYNPWDANYLAYLVIDYDKKEYNSEIERLNTYGINTYKGYYGVTGFTNYNLIAMNADSYNGFIYAITDGKERIIYVEIIFCNYYMDIKYEDEIPSEYLPDGFNAKLNNPYQLSKK